MKMLCLIQENVNENNEVTMFWNIYINPEHIAAIGPVILDDRIIEPGSCTIILAGTPENQASFVVKHTAQEVVSMINFN